MLKKKQFLSVMLRRVVQLKRLILTRKKPPVSLKSKETERFRLQLMNQLRNKKLLSRRKSVTLRLQNRKLKLKPTLLLSRQREMLKLLNKMQIQQRNRLRQRMSLML